MTDCVTEKEDQGNVESGNGGLSEVSFFTFQSFPDDQELDSEEDAETQD